MKKFLFLVIVFGWFFTTSKTTLAQLTLKSENLNIESISKKAFVHISYLQTESFGKVACNGAIFIDSNEAFIMDTPSDSVTAVMLINFLTKKNIKIVGVIVNHFHNDCLGGLSEFHAAGIPSYASNKTIIAAKGAGVIIPQNGFENNQILKVGNKEIINVYLGEAHTKDNIVTYFPSEKTLFGGCMVKEINATKGYLGDANIAEWPSTIRNVQNIFPGVQFVIPGHGKVGDKELLNYTIKLFSEK